MNNYIRLICVIYMVFASVDGFAQGKITRPTKNIQQRSSSKSQQKASNRNKEQQHLQQQFASENSQTNNAVDQYRMWKWHRANKNYREAEIWLKKSAEQGYSQAQYELGGYYDYRDRREAVKWYRKAAEQGHAGAQYCLGNIYELGVGVNKDYNEAVKWYRKAAEQGHEYAKKAIKKLQQ